MRNFLELAERLRMDVTDLMRQCNARQSGGPYGPPRSYRSLASLRYPISSDIIPT